MSTQQSSNEKLLDVATIIAISASRPAGRDAGPSVDSSTINNLLTFIQSRRDVNELLAFIMRQTGRGEIDQNTGKLLLQHLRGLSPDKAIQLLGYVKWIYETLTSRDIKMDRSKLNSVKTFSELVELIAKG
ncbi:hypothetical protein BFU36_00085 [Sulfolobus sp. A20]|uniref:hypothetical protein n=1 Tax=Saccharolobus sp. A20 TaxID=1891280 RepID=UPI000846063C|nr:hypothetical protein [Sulfolobus sp. A20]AOL15397.1 hypothetical protein BFU36_00085 [Sulfolobus sp. A20]TRM77708.1 hypothetical protein DJ532_03655 [Sulfolobus sp. A20-N-F8]TRN00979.1 hypothetical protein DJ527_06220 [Sulfolobus sp. F1]TRN03376.1 hypothetical protein DJ530_02860 [Sulfolobus sp. E1]